MTYLSVLEKRNYGKIVLKVKDVMEEKEMTRNKLSSLTGIRFEVANRLYKGEVVKLDLDILARVCFVLECNIQDLLEYQMEGKIESE